MSLTRTLRCFAVVAALPFLGCTAASVPLRQYTRERPVLASPPLPPATIDIEASEVSVLLGDTVLQPFYEGPAVRKEFAEAFTDMVGGIAGKPARFRLRGSVQRDKSYIFFIPCFIVFSLVGCPTGGSAATVDLQLQIGDRLYTANAEDWVWVGFWYNVDPVRAALARASVKAMKAIVDQARKEATP